MSSVHLPPSLDEFVKAIQDALGTAEEGDALIEVARNAHKAEQECALWKDRYEGANQALEATIEHYDDMLSEGSP